MGGLKPGFERNLQLIPWVYAGQGALFWLPVFVLYFSSTLSPSEVLLLEAVYYGAIVGFEIPSGWFSDRVGRRWTLVLSGLGWTGGAACMAFGGSVAVFACGQLFLAIGRSFASGTDSSMLFESLRALGREDEHAQRQAVAGAVGFAVIAVSAFIGGIVGLYSLQAPYWLSVGGGLVATLAALGLSEPPHAESEGVSLFVALRDALSAKEVRWVLLATVAFTVFSHVPYELQQPWLDQWLHAERTPLVSGILVALAMGGASVGSAFSARVGARIGVKAAMILAMVALTVVMGAMAAGPFTIVVPLLLLRSVPTGLVEPLASATLHPHLPSTIRATYLSGQSLAGRLAFALTLVVASQVVGEGWTLDTLRAVLVPTAVASMGMALFLAWYPLRAPDR